MNANRESVTGRFQSPREPWEKIKSKRLQATSLGDFWTARGTAMHSCQVSSYERTICLFIDIPAQGHQTISKHFYFGKGPKCYIKLKTSLQPKAQGQCRALSQCVRNTLQKERATPLCPVDLRPLFAFLFGRSRICSLSSQQTKEGKDL